MAALAANRQGKFWGFHDQLFNNFNRLSDEKIQEIARQLSLNEEQFQKDMKDPKIPERISQDIRDGTNDPCSEPQISDRHLYSLFLVLKWGLM